MASRCVLLSLVVTCAFLLGCSPQVPDLRVVVAEDADSAGASENHPPEITAIVAEPGLHVAPGEIVDLTCVATDPDEDRLVYSWSREAGSILNTGPSVLWVSPQGAGIYAVTCTVQDTSGIAAVASAEIVLSDTLITIEGPPMGTSVVRLTISGEDMAEDVTASLPISDFVDGKASHRIHVPPGANRAFEAMAQNAEGEALATGLEAATVLPGQTTEVRIVLEAGAVGQE